VASHPDCKTPGTKSDALQSIVDLPYTFLEVAGIEVPAGYQGVDQNASWIDSSDKVRDWAMVEFRPTESAFMQKTYIEDTYKLVVYHDRNYGELYDIKKDYDQMHNLWDEPEYAQIKCDMIMRFISAEMEKDGKLRPRTAIA
jgi:uncharacterized sulfatase